MTDSEKTQYLVDKLFGGKWPEHVMVPLPADDVCYRCEGHWADFPTVESELQETDMQCRAWNPLARIEDAMMVVHAMDAGYFFGLESWQRKDKGGYQASFTDITAQRQAPWHWETTPQRAIVAAAIAALEAA